MATPKKPETHKLVKVTEVDWIGKINRSKKNTWTFRSTYVLRAPSNLVNENKTCQFKIPFIRNE